LLGSQLIYAAPHDVETECQGQKLLDHFSGSRSQTGDFVAETGNHEASFGTCSRMISVAATP